MKQNIAAIIVMVILVAMLSVVVLDIINDYAVTEIECYSIAMEITHAETSTYYVKNRGTNTTRTFYLRGDDRVISVNVSAETFARFAQGDWIEVEITVKESAITHTIIEDVRIIGEAIKN